MTSTLIDRLLGVAEGLADKAPVRCASIGNITLAGLQTIDGIALAEGDRVLIKGQSLATQNGIYNAASGNWTRAADFDGARDIVSGTRVFVLSGTINAVSEWYVSFSGDFVADSTVLAFIQVTISVFSGTSATSVTIGTGAKTFVTQAGKLFLVGTYVLIMSGANVANLMQGRITAYDPVGGTLTVNVTLVGGAGTFSDWIIVVSGAPGQNGANGVITVNSPQLWPGRLTLVSGAPETVSDVTGALRLYMTPDVGNIYSLFDGVSTWNPVAAQEISIDATSTQNGTLTFGSNLIPGLSDTSGLVVGMAVSGSGIANGTVITSIVDAATISVSAGVSVTGVQALTFKLQPNSNYDIFARNSSGTVKLEYGPVWTNTTTRATGIVKQDGIDVKSGATTRRLVGTVRVTAIAGQLEDSQLRRFVSNRYNTRARSLAVRDQTANWTYTTAAWRQARGQTSNRVEVVCCVARNVKLCSVLHGSTAVAQTQFGSGIGVDATTIDSSIIRALGYVPGVNVFGFGQGYYCGSPGIGYHALNWLEYGGPNLTMGGNFSGAVLQDICQSGMAGEIEG